MGYQLIQAVAQVHQAVASQQQLWQLAQLNQQMAVQQQAAAFQANINQALFETENAARRVAATTARDAFAAAVLAHEWFPRISGIQPQMFAEVAAKRAWADAHGTLAAAAQRGDADAGLRESVHRYLRTKIEWQRLRAPLGQDPDWLVADARARVAHAHGQKEAKSRLLKVSGAGTAGLFLLFVITAAAGSAFSGLVFLLFIAGVVVVGTGAQGYMNADKGFRRARHMAGEVENMVATHHRFMADPQHGGFLQTMWHEHPLLFQEPVPDPSARASTPGSGPQVQTYVERQVVERQVVVTRCKFCKQHTPVEGPTCCHCGAPGFGS